MIGGMLEVRGVRFGGGRPAVIVPLTGTDAAELGAQADAVRAAGPDLVEWRVDLATGLGDLDDVVATGHLLVDRLGGLPLLVTIRSRAEGGAADPPGPAYLATLTALVRAGVADLVDVEVAAPDEVVAAALATARAAGVAVVASRHHVAGTPPRAALVATLRAMAERGADVCKVAVTPASVDDVLELLAACRTASLELDRPVIAIAMGELGVVSRLAGGVFGSAATFATVAGASAPGQLDLTTVRTALGWFQPGAP